MKAGVRTYLCNFALGSFFFGGGGVGGGGGGREQTPCIDWCNPNEYGFKAFWSENGCCLKSQV